MFCLRYLNKCHSVSHFNISHSYMPLNANTTSQNKNPIEQTLQVNIYNFPWILENKQWNAIQIAWCWWPAVNRRPHLWPQRNNTNDQMWYHNITVWYMKETAKSNNTGTCRVIKVCFLPGLCKWSEPSTDTNKHRWHLTRFIILLW